MYAYLELLVETAHEPQLTIARATASVFADDVIRIVLVVMTLSSPYVPFYGYSYC